MSKHLTSKSSLYIGKGRNDYIVIVPPVYELKLDEEYRESVDGILHVFSIGSIIKLHIEVKKEFSVNVTIQGIPIGTFKGDIQKDLDEDDGITISFDAWTAKGFLRFYLKKNNGNYLCLAYDLQSSTNSITGDEELFKL